MFSTAPLLFTMWWTKSGIIHSWLTVPRFPNNLRLTRGSQPCTVDMFLSRSWEFSAQQQSWAQRFLFHFHPAPSALMRGAERQWQQLRLISTMHTNAIAPLNKISSGNSSANDRLKLRCWSGILLDSTVEFTTEIWSSSSYYMKFKRSVIIYFLWIDNFTVILMFKIVMRGLLSQSLCQCVLGVNSKRIAALYCDMETSSTSLIRLSSSVKSVLWENNTNQYFQRHPILSLGLRWTALYSRLIYFGKCGLIVVL